MANIFQKINVSSRTEAALYAIEHGFVDSPRTDLDNLELLASTKEDQAPVRTKWQVFQNKYGWFIFFALLMLLAGLSALLSRSSFFFSPTQTPNALVDSLNQERWTNAEALPQAKAYMAVTTAQNSIYVIGGVTGEGVTGQMLRFDKNSNSWVKLAEKPIAVTDTAAAIVGGKIYVPGGTLADGTITDRLHVYDPETDTWDEQSPSPLPLSKFGIATFEGIIFVFGGWDGSKELETVFKYDPYTDEWSNVAPMPTARTNPAVVQAGDKIYVIGGFADSRAVKVDEVYTPSRDILGGKPWSSQMDLPEDFELVGAQNISDSVFIFGRSSDGNFTLLNFTPQNNIWNEYSEKPLINVSDNPQLATLGGNVYFIGGYDETKELTNNVVRYQAVYTIVLPRITN